ncbi:c-type cytochrome [Actibacterium sp. XHP0104]|uniref:c-type cytochrome n=1 Tax=Actibacterium sp. XHP0104 TaxID=2984335 RepID=UPI0021E7990B|nr:c-type cytochrome [Actibacterium sp. XHP0104]MCV2881361.1 c-type cytochrome [Actibacterium sp. XHP0104]
MKILYIAAAAALLGGAAYLTLAPESTPPAAETAAVPAPQTDALVQITVPEVSAEAQIGARIFAAKCAVCHGDSGVGRDGKAPPLIHKIYEPGHHGDIAFLRAVQYGVKAHHWRFGDMPPVEGVTPAEVGEVITYIREIQRANGI